MKGYWVVAVQDVLKQIYGNKYYRHGEIM